MIISFESHISVQLCRLRTPLTLDRCYASHSFIAALTAATGTMQTTQVRPASSQAALFLMQAVSTNLTLHTVYSSDFSPCTTAGIHTPLSRP